MLTFYNFLMEGLDIKEYNDKKTNICNTKNSSITKNE
jgi:hypothetical protein